MTQSDTKWDLGITMISVNEMYMEASEHKDGSVIREPFGQCTAEQHNDLDASF